MHLASQIFLIKSIFIFSHLYNGMHLLNHFTLMFYCYLAVSYGTIKLLPDAALMTYCLSSFFSPFYLEKSIFHGEEYIVKALKGVLNFNKLMVYHQFGTETLTLNEKNTCYTTS